MTNGFGLRPPRGSTSPLYKKKRRFHLITMQVVDFSSIPTSVTPLSGQFFFKPYLSNSVIRFRLLHCSILVVYLLYGLVWNFASPRLGVSLFSASAPCSACSRVFEGDTFGDHAVSCAGIVGVKHRHNIVRDTLVDICTRSEVSVGKEVDIGLGTEFEALRPADLLLYSWNRGRDVCVDLTGSSPLTQSGMADFVPGRAVLDAASRKQETRMCFSRRSPCFLKRITCPRQCPTSHPKNPKAKVCYINCYSPICKAECRNRKPDCTGRGAACLDPRLIGGDGIVFYFHGKSNEHFSLVSDHNLQINARFIGLRPSGRTRDYTWIQALGILINSHTLSLEATPAASWDEIVDHLKFSYDGEELDVPQGYSSSWTSLNEDLKIERIETRNSATLTIQDVAEISVNVVPVTKEDDRIHNYKIPPNDCFAHLEVQFRFFGLSPEVEGVLGRTYQPDFKNPAKPGVAMPIVGGENRYRTSSLLSADCKSCMFYPVEVLQQNLTPMKDLGISGCGSSTSLGQGIVCRK